MLPKLLLLRVFYHSNRKEIGTLSVETVAQNWADWGSELNNNLRDSCFL